MGTPAFAVPSLRILIESGYEIPAVVTASDKPRGRGQQVSYTAVKEFALQHKIPILQPETMKDPKFIAEVQRINPDLIIVVAFQILPRDVYTIPKLGSFNLHASLLPKYRGAAPINWAIINGEQETGVTTFFLQEKVDTGSILLQRRVRIEPDETAGELYHKLATIGAETVLQTTQLIERNEAKPYQQDDSIASPAPKIFKEHCRIDWTKSAQYIHNFVRGLSPSPGAWTTYNDKMIKIFKIATATSTSTHAGAIMKRDEYMLMVAVGDGAVSILEIQQQGKRRLGIEEFLRGSSIAVGEKFV